MFKTGMPSDSSEDASKLQQPEIELVSLYERLSKSQKGSDDYKQILQEIEGAKEQMDAHQQLFRALLDAVDRERLADMTETVLVAEKRIHTEMNELLDNDLTFTEMLRLSRLINTQIEQIDGGIRNSPRYQRQGRDRSAKLK